MTTEIRLCVPLTTVGLRREEDVEDLGGADVHVSVRMLERGPASIESHVDEVLAVPDLLRIGMEAQAQGVDAMIVDCMGDPGVEAARELLDIPVFGPAQVAMHIARRFLCPVERSRFVRRPSSYSVLETSSTSYDW